jgi:hypothetical protein
MGKPPCLDVNDPDLENDVCKTESTDYAAMEQIPIPCGARATLFQSKSNWMLIVPTPLILLGVSGSLCNRP